MPKYFGINAANLASGALAAAVFLAPAPAPAADGPAFSIPAVAAPVPPKLNGTLDDPVWKTAAHVQLQWDFTYRRPATEATDAYLLVDAKYLYVAFVAKQSETITATQHTDNIPLGSDDIVRVYLFPGGDQGFEYYFVANPLGTRYQASTENAAFSPRWDAVSTTGAGGYIVTERIPLDVMRGDGRSTWRIQFDRRVFVNNQLLEWAHDPSAGSTDSSLYAGYLTGMKAAGHRAKARPRANVYVLGEAASKTIGGSTSRIGADVALPITATASFLATFHPDYSNVELDQQTIAPTAFPRQFVEVRPFFVQGANFYNQFNCNDCVNFPLLYTPNIPTPRDGYAVEGVQGRFNFGAFTSFSDDRTDSAQAVQYATSDRTFRALFQREAVDFPGTHDDAEYAQVQAGNPHNFNVYATEGGESGTLVTDSGAGRYREYGFNLFTPKSGIFFAYHDVGEQYAPIDGFNAINDVRGPTVYGYREIDYGPSSAIQSVTFSQDLGRMRNHLGQYDDAYSISSVTINTRRLFTLNLTTGSNYLLLPGTPGGYANQNGAALSYAANSSTPSSLSYNVGRYGAGYLHSTARSLSFKTGKRASLLFEADDTVDRLDGGPTLTQWLERVAFSYQIGPESSLAIGVRRIVGTTPPYFSALQYIDASNVSVAYYHRLGRGEIYAVYGDPNAVSTLPAFILKYIFYAGSQKGT